MFDMHNIANQSRKSSPANLVELARPWLTTILDDCSRAVCGYTVFLAAPSAMSAALALRQAIWHKSDPSWSICGLPDALYVDRGSDFIRQQLTK